jgi:hypothetical protein
MSFGDNSADRAESERKIERFMKQADADRAAREAGHKSFLTRVLGRLLKGARQGSHRA